MQLHRHTHEIINTLSVRKLFLAVLAVCFIILLYRKCAVMRIITYIQKMGAVTQPEKKSESKRKIVRTAHFLGMWRKVVFGVLLLYSFSN